MLGNAPGLILPQLKKQWTVKYPNMLIVSAFVGLLIGAVSIGMIVDVFGRKRVWLVSLYAVTIFTMISAGAQNFPGLAVLLALHNIAEGGNCECFRSFPDGQNCCVLLLIKPTCSRNRFDRLHRGTAEVKRLSFDGACVVVGHWKCYCRPFR